MHTFSAPRRFGSLPPTISPKLIHRDTLDSLKPYWQVICTNRSSAGSNSLVAQHTIRQVTSDVMFHICVACNFGVGVLYTVGR